MSYPSSGREPVLKEGTHVVVLVTENPAPCPNPGRCMTPRLCETQTTTYAIMDRIAQAGHQVALRVREVRWGLPVPIDTVIKMPVRDEASQPEAGPPTRLSILHKQRLDQWDRHFAASAGIPSRKATPFLDLYRSTTVASEDTLVTIWECCSGASLESLITACMWCDVEIPAAMGAIIAVDMLTALVETLAYATSMRGGAPVIIRHRQVSTYNIFIDLGTPQVPRSSPYAYSVSDKDALPRGALGHWGGPVELSAPAQRAAAVRHGVQCLRGVLHRLRKYGQRRVKPERPGHEGLPAGGLIDRPAWEEALWQSVRYHVGACYNRLTERDAKVAAVLLETRATFQKLEEQALDKDSAAQDDVLDKFRDRVRRPWQKQRPRPLEFVSALEADEFCAKVLYLVPGSWRVGVVVDGKIQLPFSYGL
ncbi:hypothetical protein RB595_001990 [Gaeumannomyces hyphopodioides]